MDTLGVSRTFHLQNILTFTPPGFKQSLNVKFPDSRLAVCEKCKKNFKTKDMCRVRNSHTAPPWSTAYICITLDDSCTDDEGKFIDKPMTLRMVTWRPYNVRKPFHPKTPVCAGCKRTNRTRSFCRERHKHRQLPWCTVYVLLSALDQADPSTVVAAPSKPLDSGEEDSKSPAVVTKDSKEESTSSSEHKADDGDFGMMNGPPKRTASSTDVASASSETISSDVDDVGDDINDIPESRTFLAKVNSRGCSIHWLDLAEYEDTSTPTYSSPDTAGVYSTPSLTPPQMDPNVAQAHYYAQAHYAQQHQNALQSHQQYFFHMQQRQHQQYAQWQQQYAQQMAQGGDPSVMPTAAHLPVTDPAGTHRLSGEGGSGSPAAAAVTASPGQAWPPPMYYAAPPGFYSPPSGAHMGTPSMAGTMHGNGENQSDEGHHLPYPQHHVAPSPGAHTHPGEGLAHPIGTHHQENNDDDHNGNSNDTEDEPDSKRLRTV